jgi:chorismate mutase-like protein
MKLLRSSSIQYALICIWMLGLTGCSDRGQNVLSPSTSQLPNLIVERLRWMDEVAMVKQARSLPVTDAKREAELLAAVEVQAAQQGIPPRAARDFFAGQIEAAKNFQMEWLAQHLQQPTDTSSLPDLAKDVRPALDHIGQRMLAALAVSRREDKPELVVPAAVTALKQAGFSQSVIVAAITGLEAGLR